MKRFLVAPIAALLAFVPTVSASKRIRLETIQLPPGFQISVLTQEVPGARSMTLSPSGTLFVGTRGTEVYAIPNAAQGGSKVIRILKNLDTPNGVAFKDGALYVAEINRVLRFDGIEGRLSNPPKPVVVNDGFPSDTHHGWKFIAFGPDGKLYVPVGAPCNVCERKDQRYASIMRMKADGSGLEVFASGVRNTVGFDWHPTTHELWFTDNGRDWMGDNAPPDELDRATRKGQNFGFPFCHGKNVADPKFGKGRDCASGKEFTLPEMDLAPHVAALGMRFYTGRMFPESYRGQILIAEHGSWNRSQPIGYRITLVRLEGGHAVKYEPFAQGWLQGREAWGRPVDVQVAPDGALLVSDDLAGAIYRISRK